jgi:hypothetical protein
MRYPNIIPRAKRSASTRIAVAAIQEPMMRTPMRCQSRFSRPATIAIRITVRQALIPVPISVAVATTIEIASGGES